MRREVLTVILAGGKGTRLEPLTRDRAKPSVPFGGAYRIIDFTLSNCIHSNLRRILMLTQYKALSLDRHVREGWSFLPAELGEWVELIPPQQRIDENWYKGTADAIYQNIYSIEREDPELTLILAGDHIYKMDYREMIAFHRQKKADLTIGCIPIPRSETKHFGIMEVDKQHSVLHFKEKPASADPMPEDPNRCLGSMGIYVFNTHTMFEVLFEDAASDSAHDFGKSIIPRMIGHQRVFAYPFRDRDGQSTPYWRDVGTLDAYFEANMDLVSVHPQLNLYETDWPIRTRPAQLPPPKFVFSQEGSAGEARRGEALDSLVCPGCIISGGSVRRSILSPRVRVNSYAIVEDSILFDGVDVGRHCHIRNTIIDKEVKIPPHTHIGVDLERERRRGFTVTELGVVVVPKGEPPETFQVE